jgi:hypothetical protein
LWMFLLISASPAPALAGVQSTSIVRTPAGELVEGRDHQVPQARLGSHRSRLPASGAAPQGSAARSALAERLASHRQAFRHGPDGSIEAVYGLPLAEARAVFFPVSRTRALPEGYVPPDLAWDLGHPLRALVVGELRAMFEAAAREGAYPVVVSGYRSAEYQATVFERAVQRQLARGEAIEREEAERLAARFVAPPGHSQHQLGTTADLSSWEIGYAIRPTFAETLAGRWLAEHAWEYGFILPYTEAAQARSGYIAEPWHVRWIGRSLAALLWEEAYLASENPTADDWLLALEELMGGA